MWESERGLRRLRRKILVTLCLVMALLFTSALPLHAFTPSKPVMEMDIGIEPFWANVISITASLQFDNGRGTLNGSVIANLGTTSITVDAVLERVNANGTTTHINSWNNLHASGRSWSWHTTHFVTRGHDYRLTLTATVLRNGVSETVSMSHTSRAHWSDLWIWTFRKGLIPLGYWIFGYSVRSAFRVPNILPPSRLRLTRGSGKRKT